MLQGAWDRGFAARFRGFAAQCKLLNNRQAMQAMSGSEGYIMF